MKKKTKRGQLNLSLGMIFSIILIIAIFSIAFYVIKTLLKGQEQATTGLFITDLQKDIDKIWKSSQGSQEYTYNLPKKIAYICFMNTASPKSGPKENLYSELRRAGYENENLFFYPIQSTSQQAVLIDHIDLETITENENPFCIQNDQGIKITLKKDFGKNLVNIQ